MTPTRSQPQSALCRAALIFMLIIAPSTAWGQANAPDTSASLPTEAQAAMKKGVTAAQGQDYQLALRFFQDARKLAPDAPIIHFNLGLAESRIPGRELRAIAWFGAYLAAYPNAPSAAAVKERMVALVVNSQRTRARLIRAVEEAANISGSNGRIADASCSPRQSTSDTQPRSQPVTVSDWLQKLDDDNKGSDCPLNVAPFLDLAGYLRSLPSSENPQNVFKSFHETVEKIVKGQSIIDEMLRRQVVFSEQQAGLIELQVSRENARIATSVQLVSLAAGTDSEESTKQFEVRNGKSRLAPKGTLSISLAGIYFVEKDHPEKKKWNFACHDVNEVRASGVPWAKMVLWIRFGNDEHMFITDSGSEAKTIVETVRVACKLDRKGKKQSKTGI